MYLTEMAYSRDNAIEYVRDVLPEIKEHLIKCILYQDMTDTVSHWINTEITPDIYDIATIKTKTPRGKLTENDYITLFIESFNDDVEDAARDMMSFYRHNRRNPEYPIRVPTEENAQKLARVYDYFKTQFSKNFSEKTTLTKEQINQVMWGLLA